MDVYIKEGRVYGLLKNRKILKLTLDNQRLSHSSALFSFQLQKLGVYLI